MCLYILENEATILGTHIYIYQSIGDIDNYLPTCISCPGIGERTPRFFLMAI